MFEIDAKLTFFDIYIPHCCPNTGIPLSFTFMCLLAGLVGLVHLLAIVDGVLMVSFNVSSFCFIDADTFSSLAFVLHSMCFNRLIFFSLIYCFQFFLFFGKSIYCPLWHNIFSLVSDNFIVIVENRI